MTTILSAQAQLDQLRADVDRLTREKIELETQVQSAKDAGWLPSASQDDWEESASHWDDDGWESSYC